jgi:hypothetical protein
VADLVKAFVPTGRRSIRSFTDMAGQACKLQLGRWSRCCRCQHAPNCRTSGYSTSPLASATQCRLQANLSSLAVTVTSSHAELPFCVLS